MVKKLYKHEFAALFKWIIPLNLICLLLAIVSRFNMEVIDDGPLAILAGIIMFAYGISLVSLAGITFIIVIKRFYSHLLSQEGYLTFTIPVTPMTHIICKLICGCVAVVVSYCIIGLSVGVITSGIVSNNGISYYVIERWKMIKEAVGYVSTYRIVFLAVSAGIMGIATVFSGLLFVYAAIALGQRSRKNRVASAVGWYFILSIGRNMVKSVFEGLMTYVSSSSETVISPPLEVAEEVKLMVDSLQVMVIYNLIDALVWGALFFWITSYMLTTKLNLE